MECYAIYMTRAWSVETSEVDTARQRIGYTESNSVEVWR